MTQPSVGVTMGRLLWWQNTRSVSSQLVRPEAACTGVVGSTEKPLAESWQRKGMHIRSHVHIRPRVSAHSTTSVSASWVRTSTRMRSMYFALFKLIHSFELPPLPPSYPFAIRAPCAWMLQRIQCVYHRAFMHLPPRRHT